jgi:hypothetical protein
MCRRYANRRHATLEHSWHSLHSQQQTRSVRQSSMQVFDDTACHPIRRSGKRKASTWHPPATPLPSRYSSPRIVECNGFNVAQMHLTHAAWLSLEYLKRLKPETSPCGARGHAFMSYWHTADGIAAARMLLNHLSISYSLAT